MREAKSEEEKLISSRITLSCMRGEKSALAWSSTGIDSRPESGLVYHRSRWARSSLIFTFSVRDMGIDVKKGNSAKTTQPIPPLSDTEIPRSVCHSQVCNTVRRRNVYIHEQ